MNENIKVLGIIPARGGSRRIPRKNVVRVGGRPLISFAIHAAEQSQMLDACIVSTDDPRIAKMAKAMGADVPFLRPKKFARDDSPDIAYVLHALRWLEKHRGWKPEIVVLLPPDVPSRTGRMIDDVVHFMIKGKFDSVRTLIRPQVRFPYKAMWTVRDGETKRIAPLFPELVGVPRQQLPECYLSIGAVYATRARFVRQGTLWGARIGGYLLKGAHVEIDEPEDLAQAAAALHKQKHP